MEKAETYRDLLHCTQGWIWEVDARGVYTYSSPQVRDILGYEVDEIVGKRPFDLMPEADRAAIEHEFNRAVEAKAPLKNLINTNLHKNGSQVILETNGIPFFNVQGELIGYRGLDIDISQRRRAEEALKHSHDLLKYIVEHTRSAVAVHDRDLRYLYVSQRYLDEYDVRGSDIIGKHHYEVFPDLPQKWRDVPQRVLKGEVLSAEEDSYPKDDGSVVWTRWECRPWYQQDGLIGGMIVYTEVITDRILAAEHLRENEQKYRALFEEAAHGTVVADIDTGIIVSCNNKMAQMLGWETEEIVGKHQSFLHPSHGLDGEYSKTFKAHRSFAAGQLLEDQLIRKDGKLVDVEIMASHLSFGSRRYVQGFFYDISDRKKLLREYQRSAQLAALGTVAAGVAHEINNPIQGIINYATMIVSTPDKTDRVSDFSQRIINEGNRVAKITRELLQYARDNRGDFSLVNILEPITAAVSLLKYKMQQNRIEVLLELPATPVVMRVHPQWIQQVVVNLIDNACDALREKGGGKQSRPIEVYGRVEASGGEQEFVLDVLDYGIGIPADLVARVQDVFFTTKQESKGTGLGLAIITDIVSKHHGTLNIDSEHGQFTKVTVRLPVID